MAFKTKEIKVPFQKKPYKNIAGIKIPRPPHGATHILINSNDGKKARVAIKDVDCLVGTQGTIHYLQLDHKHNVKKVFDKEYNWNGKEIVELIGVE